MITSVYWLLENRGKKFADHVAIVEGESTTTYADLLCLVKRQAQRLEEYGFVRGDRVAIHLPKTLDEVVATFAVAALGGVTVNINYQWSTRQLSHVVLDCEATVLITDASRLKRLADIRSDTPIRTIYTVGGDAGDIAKAWKIETSGKTSFEGSPVISNDLAALLYTSGSTGMPKGVMVTHSNLLDGAEIVATYLAIDQKDRLLSVPPFNFDYGLNQLLVAVYMGATLVLQRFPLPTEILKSINQYGITVLPLVAPSWAQFIQLLAQAGTPVPSLRLATNTGGKIPNHLLAKIPAVMPDVRFFLMYGLTEAFRSTYLPPELFTEKLGSIGKAVPDNEVFVVHPDLGICGTDEIGELIHRGCLVSRGYWGQPGLTNERIRINPHLTPVIGEEPVVHSGDLARRDADGILWFEGRMDDLIKSSGFRISPTEVEDVITAIDGINEVIAYGADDENLGQAVHIVIAGDHDVSESQIITHCRHEMPLYMLPRKIDYWGKQMPRTANGKLDRPTVISTVTGKIKPS